MRKWCKNGVVAKTARRKPLRILAKRAIFLKSLEIFRRECTSLLFYAKMSLHCETQCGENCLCVSGNKKNLLIMA